jgi:uncharacterized protein
LFLRIRRGSAEQSHGSDPGLAPHAFALGSVRELGRRPEGERSRLNTERAFGQNLIAALAYNSGAAPDNATTGRASPSFPKTQRTFFVASDLPAQTADYHESYLIGVRLFNQGDYFEAHEHWEDAWNDASRGERDFYKGLIQAAVALCHFYNGNARGARRLFHSSGALLGAFRPIHRGLDLDRLSGQMETCFQPILVDESIDWIFDGAEALSMLELKLHPEPEHWPPIPCSARTKRIRVVDYEPTDADRKALSPGRGGAASA